MAKKLLTVLKTSFDVRQRSYFCRNIHLAVDLVWSWRIWIKFSPSFHFFLTSGFNEPVSLTENRPNNMMLPLWCLTTDTLFSGLKAIIPVTVFRLLRFYWNSNDLSTPAHLSLNVSIFKARGIFLFWTYTVQVDVTIYQMWKVTLVLFMIFSNLRFTVWVRWLNLDKGLVFHQNNEPKHIQTNE